jgi:hypothetical protein
VDVHLVLDPAQINVFLVAMDIIIIITIVIKHALMDTIIMEQPDNVNYAIQHVLFALINPRLNVQIAHLAIF